MNQSYLIKYFELLSLKNCITMSLFCIKQIIECIVLKFNRMMDIIYLDKNE